MQPVADRDLPAMRAAAASRAFEAHLVRFVPEHVLVPSGEKAINPVPHCSFGGER